jgi:hypothetical protein
LYTYNRYISACPDLLGVIDSVALLKVCYTNFLERQCY